jgi:hypothetical protein
VARGMIISCTAVRMSPSFGVGQVRENVQGGGRIERGVVNARRVRTETRVRPLSAAHAAAALAAMISPRWPFEFLILPAPRDVSIHGAHRAVQCRLISNSVVRYQRRKLNGGATTYLNQLGHTRLS